MHRELVEMLTPGQRVVLARTVAALGLGGKLVAEVVRGSELTKQERSHAEGNVSATAAVQEEASSASG